MGCAASTKPSFIPGKNPVEFRGGSNGNVGNKLGYKIDARCPLTERQLYQIGKSWKAISRNMEMTAVNMFVRLFETNAEILTFFSQFKNFDTLADLRSSAALEGHAMSVITTLDEAITNLDDVDYVINVLHKVAVSHHRKFPFFNAEFFLKVEEPFLLAVKETLGDRFTVTMAQTYRMAIRFILNTLANGFKLASQLESNQTAKTPVSELVKPTLSTSEHSVKSTTGTTITQA